MIIARLAAGLHCYEPERADAVWARLRHLGARRSQLTTDATAEVNQVRDLLECAWPAVLSASGSPFRSASWRAAVAVVLDRCAGDLARVRRLGEARFTAAVRRELPRWGAARPCLRIVRAVFEALADSAGDRSDRCMINNPRNCPRSLTQLSGPRSMPGGGTGAGCFCLATDRGR